MMRLKEQGCGRSLAVRGGVRGGEGGLSRSQEGPQRGGNK